MRGFVSVIMVLAMLLFLARGLQVYGQVYKGTQEMKNLVVLRQAINEATYELEDGFRLIVLGAIETLPRGHYSEKGELIAREHVCSKILEWAGNYNYSLYIGYIDPNDYSKAPQVAIAEPCLNFLYVDLRQMNVQIKDNDLIDFPYSLVGYRIAFMFEGRVGGSGFKAIIPEGTEIS